MNSRLLVLIIGLMTYTLTLFFMVYMQWKEPKAQIFQPECPDRKDVERLANAGYYLHPLEFQQLYGGTYKYPLRARNERLLARRWILRQRQKLSDQDNCNKFNVSLHFAANQGEWTIPESYGQLEHMDELQIEQWLEDKGFVVDPEGKPIKPTDCMSRETVALLVPYRNRSQNLLSFLAYMHRYLQLQRRQYRIFILEQDNDALFNRAKLFNAGMRVIMKMESANRIPVSECLILHDVDKLPHHLGNLYSCSRQPRQMLIEHFNHTDPPGWERYYSNFFGGVTSFTRWHWQRTNGASNVFYGWGGEDDDLITRVVIAGMRAEFASERVGQYWIKEHANDMHVIPYRYHLLKAKAVLNRIKYDGLDQVVYNLTKFEENPLYTRIVLQV